MDYLIFFLVSLSLIKVKKSKKKAEAKSKLVIGLSLMKLTQVREIHRSRKIIFNQLEKVVDDPFQQLVDCFIVAALIEA